MWQFEKCTCHVEGCHQVDDCAWQIGLHVIQDDLNVVQVFGGRVVVDILARFAQVISSNEEGHQFPAVGKVDLSGGLHALDQFDDLTVHFAVIKNRNITLKKIVLSLMYMK